MQNIVLKYNFAAALKLSLKKRMPYYEEIETYLLAAILDPRSDFQQYAESIGEFQLYVIIIILNL